MIVWYDGLTLVSRPIKASSPFLFRRRAGEKGKYRLLPWLPRQIEYRKYNSRRNKLVLRVVLNVEISGEKREGRGNHSACSELQMQKRDASELECIRRICLSVEHTVYVRIKKNCKV